MGDGTDKRGEGDAAKPEQDAGTGGDSLKDASDEAVRFLEREDGPAFAGRGDAG